MYTRKLYILLENITFCNLLCILVVKHQTSNNVTTITIQLGLSLLCVLSAVVLLTKALTYETKKVRAFVMHVAFVSQKRINRGCNIKLTIRHRDNDHIVIAICHPESADMQHLVSLTCKHIYRYFSIVIYCYIRVQLCLGLEAKPELRYLKFAVKQEMLHGFTWVIADGAF